MICRKGLGIEYIQSSTPDPIALKSLNEGIFVHDRAARRVYQPRGRFHLCEFCGTDQVTGRFDKNKMDGENVGLGEKLILRYECGSQPVRLLLRRAIAPGNHMHIEGLG